MLVVPKRVRSLIFSFYIPELLFSTGWGLVLPVLPRLSVAITGSIAGAAAITALVAAGTLIIDIPAGIVVGRLRQRTMMTIVLLVLVIAAFLACLANGVLLLVTAAVFMGLCRGSWFVMRMNFARHTVAPSERGRILATLGGMNRIGSLALGPLLGGFLAGMLGIRTPFIVVIFLMIIAILVLKRWVPNRVAQKNNIVHASENNPLSIFLEHWRVFLRTGPAILIFSLIRAVRLLLIPLWGQWIGLSVTEVGIAISVSGIADMLLFYPTGIIMDRLGRHYAATSSILLMSASLALMPLTESFISLLLVAVLSGVGNGLGAGLSMTVGSDLSPQRGSGEFIGIWRLINDIGNTAGPAAISLITATVALSFAGPILALLGVCGASLFIFVVKETKQHS